MSKPEEIPADVWSRAESALDNMLCNCIEASGSTEQFRIDSIEPIARAIMAAKAEQREADAKIAEGFDTNEQLLPYLPDNDANHAAAVGQEYAADEIAAAIRKGGAT